MKLSKALPARYISKFFYKLVLYKQKNMDGVDERNQLPKSGWMIFDIK